MIETSIIFSIRNRVQELAVSLPSILSKYDQATTELVIMDDKSKDGSKDLVLALLGHHGWDNYQLVDSNRETDGYDISQAHQTNMLVSTAQGKYILLQSAEVAHIEPLIDGLRAYCLPGQPAFATVVDAPANEGMLLKDTPKLASVFSSNRVIAQPEAVIFNGHSLVHGTMTDTVVQGAGTGLSYRVYCGLVRPVPLFFCGMILKSDWDKLGGYSPTLPTDMLFWDAMTNAGFKYAFTKYLALHITHGRI